jgi:hypothetical protein
VYFSGWASREFGVAETRSLPCCRSEYGTVPAAPMSMEFVELCALFHDRWNPHLIFAFSPFWTRNKWKRWP